MTRLEELERGIEALRGAIDSRGQESPATDHNPIPIEKRTKHLNLKEAARMLGITGKRATAKVREEIDKKEMPGFKVNRHSYIFDYPNFRTSRIEYPRITGGTLDQPL